MYKMLLVAHILGVFLIVGGAAIATALGIKTSKLSRTRTVAELTGLSIVAERFVITPGAIMALVAGSLLVHEAGYTFDAFWIVAAYVLWVVAISVGWGPLGRHTVRVHQHAKQLVAEGVEESDELHAHAAAPLATALGLLQNLILLAFIYLMVVRPGS
jgi:uncharacterized membrane protein